MSTDVTPINKASTEPVQKTEQDVATAPVENPVLMAIINLSKAEAVNIMTTLLNGLLISPETYQPSITLPMDRIKIGTPKV